MKYASLILLMMFFSMDSLLKAQNGKKLEVGINGIYFNFDHTQSRNNTYSDVSLKNIKYEFNAFANIEFSKSQSFFHINVNKRINELIERNKNIVDNIILKEYNNDSQANNSTGFYLGLGKNLIFRSKYKLQVLSRIGYQHTKGSKSYTKSVGLMGIEYESLSTQPETQSLALQTELKFGYNFYKNIFISAGFFTSLNQKFVNGKAMSRSVSYNNSNGVEIYENIEEIESKLLRLHPFTGFIGLSIKL